MQQYVTGAVHDRQGAEMALTSIHGRGGARSWRSIRAILAGAVVLASCGSGASEPEDAVPSPPPTDSPVDSPPPDTTSPATDSVPVQPEGSEPPATATTTTTSAAPPTDAAEVVPPGTRTVAAVDLQSVEQPPEGVAALIDWAAAGGDGPAECDPTADPTINVFAGPYEEGAPAWVCVSGFVLGEPVLLEVTDPTGELVYSSNRPDLLTFPEAFPFWFWYATPDSVHGTHVLTATQGDLSAQATVEVIPPSFRRMEAVSSTEIYLYEYPPNEVLRVFLYEAGEQDENGLAVNLTYVAELSPVTLSAAGGAIYEFASPPDRPVCIRTELDQSEGASSCLPTNEVVYPESDAASQYPELQVGDSGGFVEILQRRLTENGYDIAIDRTFGPGTDAAVRSFEGESGLPADGIVGSDTWAVLLGTP